MKPHASVKARSDETPQWISIKGINNDGNNHGSRLRWRVAFRAGSASELISFNR